MIRFRSLAVLAAVLLAGSAAAQERCEGTFCDLYYGGSAPAAQANAQPAAPKPMTAPSMPSMAGTGNFFSNMFSRSDGATLTASAGAQPASQDSGFFRMGGGGLTGQNRGSECGGTLCDLYHGHSSEAENEASTPQSVNGVPVSRFGNDTAPARPIQAAAQAVASTAAAPPAAERRVAVRVEPKPPACALKGSDPWACYRR